MSHRQTVHEVAQRLPHRTKREVEEVLQVLSEVWGERLAAGDGEVILQGLGKLSMEVQTFQGKGVVEGKGEVVRVQGRFRPAKALRLQRMKEKG